MSKGLQQKKRPKIVDVIISLCIIGVLFGVVISRYQRMYDEARKTALRSELTNIRSSIKLFKMLNGRNPGSLTELVEMEVLQTGRTESNQYSGSLFNRNYLVPNAVDTKGNILDAFGNRFYYDPANAGVKATTKGYEDW